MLDRGGDWGLLYHNRRPEQACAVPAITYAAMHLPELRKLVPAYAPPLPLTFRPVAA